MKVLVIGHLTGQDITSHLAAEGRLVAELRAEGLIRDVFLKADRSGPILLLNDTDAGNAEQRLARPVSEDAQVSRPGPSPLGAINNRKLL